MDQQETAMATTNRAVYCSASKPMASIAFKVQVAPYDVLDVFAGVYLLVVAGPATNVSPTDKQHNPEKVALASVQHAGILHRKVLT